VTALLGERPAWYVLGPLIGLVVIGLLATINQRIGVLGGYSNVVERATGRTAELGWKAWFLFGVLGGGLLFRVLAGSSAVPDGYGWLTRTFDDSVAAGALVAAGGGRRVRAPRSASAPSTRAAARPATDWAGPRSGRPRASWPPARSWRWPWRRASS